jgi:hypothetical protein
VKPIQEIKLQSVGSFMGALKSPQVGGAIKTQIVLCSPELKGLRINNEKKIL